MGYKGTKSRKNYSRPRRTPRPPFDNFPDTRAVIASVFPFGRAFRKNTKPCMFALGIQWFTPLEVFSEAIHQYSESDVLELKPERPSDITGIRVNYKIDTFFDQPSNNLEATIRTIILLNERRFVEFFNKAQLITNRMHALELLPGIGKNHTKSIVSERKSLPFTSLDDLEERTKLLDTVPILTKRVLLELTESQKHCLFTKRRT